MSSDPQLVSIKPYRAIIGLNYAGSTAGVNSSGAITSTSNLQTTTITADAVVEEKHDDELIITEHPVEQGSVISDHAYKLPAKLEMVYSWAAGSSQNTAPTDATGLSFLQQLYQTFLALQAQRIGCTVYTGKRQYQNMLMQTISTTSDKENENVLQVRVVMQEVILASVTLLPISPSTQQAFPSQTSGTVNQGNVSLGSAPNFNSAAAP